ncbi:MAG TPA: heme-copper oxidase subunit III [Ktedonobacterales bacterium]|jgi:heme/copper-type cytochrome/quinol oxidase subunit 3
MSAVAKEHAEVHEEAVSEGRPLAWWGMVFFIASEALLFANLIAAYLYLLVRQPHWPPPGNIPLELVSQGNILPAINTVILLSSSFPMIFARRAMNQGKLKQVPWYILATIVLGAIFLMFQGVEYGSLFAEGNTPSNGLVGSTFFTLTGFHGAHVTGGVIFLLVQFFKGLRGGFTQKKHFSLLAAEMYWHFVDVVWIFVFSLVYLLPEFLK